VTFTPTAAGYAGGSLTVNETDAAGTQVASLAGTGYSNQTTVNVNLGPYGGYYDGIFTSVTVCQPGTANCQTIDNVLVDTGSFGLRVFSDEVAPLSLAPISDGDGNYLFECVEYGDMTYTWGPMAMATVIVGGELATQTPGGTANAGIPIQVITTNGSPPPASVGDCASGGGGSDNTELLLGANGLLGIGTFPQDCGATCEETPVSSDQSPWPYIVCNFAGCNYTSVQPVHQAWNPVAAFSTSDINGVMVSLPSVLSEGSPSVSGPYLYFGIDTQANNTITSPQTIYALDQYGYFQSATYNNVTYTSANSGGTFIDSGSNAYYVSDSTTLDISDCASPAESFYCPTTPVTFPLGLSGSNSNSTTVSLTIANAETLFTSGNGALDDLGGPSCIPTTGLSCGPPSGNTISNDSWDLGLPFFFGRPIFVGIAGATTNGTTYDNGYWAF